MLYSKYCTPLYPASHTITITYIGLFLLGINILVEAPVLYPTYQHCGIPPPPHISAQTLPYKDNDLIDRKFEVGTFWLRSYVQGWHTKDFGRILQIVFHEI